MDFGRVNGNLALSRAIGDFEFKKSADLPPEQQIVTAFPDVTVHELGEDDEFLVIACDGMLFIIRMMDRQSADSNRYLGLSVFAGGRRVRSERYCGKAGATFDL